MKMDDKLNDIFNIKVKPVDVVDIVSEPKEEKDDFTVARETLRGMIDKNENVIDDLMSIAKSSEHPRAFEVVAELVKAQTGLAKELMTLHKIKKDIDGEQEPSKIGTQNNIVFAGSTADLMKMISAERAKIIDSK
jgi:hypothetical protein